MNTRYYGKRNLKPFRRSKGFMHCERTCIWSARDACTVHAHHFGDFFYLFTSCRFASPNIQTGKPCRELQSRKWREGRAMQLNSCVHPPETSPSTEMLSGKDPHSAKLYHSAVYSCWAHPVDISPLARVYANTVCARRARQPNLNESWASPYF